MPTGLEDKRVAPRGFDAGSAHGIQERLATARRNEFLGKIDFLKHFERLVEAAHRVRDVRVGTQGNRAAQLGTALRDAAAALWLAELEQLFPHKG